MSRLRRGDLAPRISVPPPGPRSRRLSRRLGAAEAPGINTLFRGRPAIVWEEALGANILDVDGNRYVDLTAGFGVASVGHRHPRVELAERLAARAPVDDGRVYLAVSGSDAVEVALKSALLATGRADVVAFDPGYHGLSLGALAATSRDEFRRPFAEHLHQHLYRLPFAAPGEEIGELLAARRPAAVIVEPLVGREGIVRPPAGWLASLAAACRRHGALLVADEIFTGFGRTGLDFAVDAEGVRPDLLCCGKALGGGLPVGAVVGRADLLAAWRSDGEARHTGTFVGHPLAAAAALAVLDLLDGERLAERAARLGGTMVGPRLARWPERHPRIVSEVRGRGLAWGVELRSAELAGRLATDAAGRGLLLLAGGASGRVAQIVPPLTVAESQLEVALEILEELLGELEEG